MEKTSGETIKLALVDEQPIARKGVVSSLSVYPRFTVVAESSTVDGMLRDAAPRVPDVVLLDGHAVASAATELRRRLPNLKIIVFSSSISDDAVRRIVNAGVRGCVVKTSEVEEVIKAIETVYAGGAYFSPSFFDAVTWLLSRNGDLPYVPGGVPLTPREREVLVLVASGCTSRDIASRLGLSARTVDSHREHIKRKLDIHTIAGLTRFAVANGLVDPR